MIRIDKDIPIPQGGRGNRVYPWAKLKVGDSFAVPVQPGSEGPQVAAGRRQTGFRFMKQRRMEGDPPQEVWRVWRIK